MIQAINYVFSIWCLAFNIIWVCVSYTLPFRYSLENKNYIIYSCVILRVFSISVYCFCNIWIDKTFISLSCCVN